MIKSLLDAMKMCMQNMEKIKIGECKVEEINPREEILTDTCSMMKAAEEDSKDSRDSRAEKLEKAKSNNEKISLKMVNSQRSSNREEKKENREIVIQEKNLVPQQSNRSHKSNISHLSKKSHTEKDKINSVRQEFVLQKVNTFANDLEEPEEKISDVLSPKFIEDIYSRKNTLSQQATNENLNLLNFQPQTINTDPESVRNQFFQSEMEKLEKITHSKATKNYSKESNRGLLFTSENLAEEIPDKVFCMNNIVILDSEISQAKKLVVEDEEGELLSNHYLVIDASGLLNGLRKKRDGYVFFGPTAEHRGPIINDFVVNFNKEQCKTRLFVIFYQRNDQKYYIRNINDSDTNVLMYIKMTYPYAIKRKQYFSINQIAFSVDPQNEEGNSKDQFHTQSNLKIVIYEQTVEKEKDKERESLNPENGLGSTKSTSTNKVFIFKPADSPVTIGRCKCSISLDFSFLSKRHCTIEYNKKEGVWEICDGYNGKHSTNGTWLLLKSKFEICDTTYVKIGTNVIKVGQL